MPSGGKRIGAGRKPGPRTPVERVKRSLSAAAIRRIHAEERDPLQRLVEIAFDADAPLELQLQAAASATPYLHPKLSAMVVAQVPKDMQAEHAAVMGRVMERLGRIASAQPLIEGAAVSEEAESVS